MYSSEPQDPFEKSHLLAQGLSRDMQIFSGFASQPVAAGKPTHVLSPAVPKQTEALQANNAATQVSEPSPAVIIRHFRSAHPAEQPSTSDS
ncbi:hypothetical protein C8034_v005259 [Colletotrichum sidae]|uniref:Uncharacterized protein n=1 Tax=Colletotrichum sidae TaxID=1347389 RepID=A0A4R8T6V3_9PEZI|nr:hypothetical protein C8034_v005259 [Colletotrichum sidae]